MLFPPLWLWLEVTRPERTCQPGERRWIDCEVWKKARSVEGDESLNLNPAATYSLLRQAQDGKLVNHHTACGEPKSNHDRIVPSALASTQSEIDLTPKYS